MSSWLSEVDDLKTTPWTAAIKFRALECGQVPSRKKLTTLFYYWSKDIAKSPNGTFRFLEKSQSTPRCRLIRSCTLRQKLEHYSIRPLLGRNWDMVFLPIPSALSLSV